MKGLKKVPFDLLAINSMKKCYVSLEKINVEFEKEKLCDQKITRLKKELNKLCKEKALRKKSKKNPINFQCKIKHECSGCGHHFDNRGNLRRHLRVDTCSTKKVTDGSTVTFVKRRLELNNNAVGNSGKCPICKKYLKTHLRRHVKGKQLSLNFV